MFVPLELNSSDGKWAMSISLGYFSHAKTRNTKYTRTCACAQTLRSHCYLRAQGDKCSHNKDKDFQRNESRDRQSDLLLISFSR